MDTGLGHSICRAVHERRAVKIVRYGMQCGWRVWLWPDGGWLYERGAFASLSVGVDSPSRWTLIGADVRLFDDLNIQ